MKNSRLASSTIILSLTALAAALCFADQPAFAQRNSESSPSATTQQPMQPDEQNNTDQKTADRKSADQYNASVHTFSGKIVKSGNKFVLAASDNLTTYQLDDQQKAQDFRNKSVRVTGSLDASTGTIRVTAIDPS
jgi:uncharacterized protein YdeI (BOF family)